MYHINYTWSEFDIDIIKLQTQIEKSKFEPDFIVALTRGGSVLGTALSYRLNIPILYIDPKNRFIPFLGKLYTSSILVVDEINDSGSTLKEFKSLLISNLNLFNMEYQEDDLNSDTILEELNSVKFLTIFTNFGSIFKVDFFINEIDKIKQPDIWVTFPWERQFNETYQNIY